MACFNSRLSLYSVTFVIGIAMICKCETTGKLTGPIFIKEPKSGKYEFLSSDGIQFDCTAHGEPYPKISWFKQDGFEHESEVVQIPSLMEIRRNGTLVLKSFKPEKFTQDIHATVYRCSASNVHGRIISGSISVRGTTKQQQHQIQAQVYDEYVVTGNTAVLKCHIPAFYKDDLNVVSWVREDNKVITRNQPGPDVFVTQNGHLHINSVTAEMNLKLGYWCQVKNRITEETFLSQSAGRIILTDSQGGVAPVITDIMKTVSIERGKAVKLPCAAQGSPPPTYKWISDVDNKVVSNSATHLVQDTEKAGSQIYSCIVENKFGSGKKSTEVVIRAPLEVFIEPNLQVVDSGTKISMNCNVQGYPIVKIKWMLNGKTLDTNSNVAITSNGKLEVLTSTRKDEGMYQCFASNDWEEVQSTAQVILGDLAPKFTQVFKAKTLQPGPSISLICIASGRPSPSINWKHNGRYLQDNDRYVFKHRIIRIGTVHSKVIIKSLRATDGGDYSCVATNKVNNVSHTAKINVYGLPIVHSIDNVTVAAGQDSVLRCYVSGHPISSIQWERDGMFSDLPDNIHSFDNGSILISKARKSNSGSYSCIAKNGRGQEDKKFTFIKVLAKPSISGITYERILLEEGDPFSAMCSVSKGDEPIQIIWKHNDNPIVLKHGIDIATTKMYSVLQIRDANEHQEGNYTCFAENEAGFDIKTVELKLNLAPKWKIEPRDIDASVGASVSFDCVATGDPNPSIKWVKMRGRKVDAITNKSTNKVLYENGTFVITEVNYHDRGDYSCIASNGIGGRLVKKITLTIKDIPVIKFLSRSKFERSGQNTTILCEIFGSGTISTQWYKEKEMIQKTQARVKITEEKKKKSLKSNLSITELVEGDSGKYQCSAKNSNGQSNKHMQLTVMPYEKAVLYTNSQTKPTTTTLRLQTEVFLKEEVLEKSQKDAVNIENTRNDKTGMKNSDIKMKDEHDNYELAESKDSSFDIVNINLKAVMFIVPAAAVIILLIAIIITIVVYLVIRHKNMKNKKECKRSKDYSGIDTLNRSIQGKNYDQTGSINRRYGKLERPLPIPNSENDQEQYEIPDYYAGMKPYSTLQYSARYQPQMNTMSRNSQASL